jgi:hypothetical protein
MESPRKASLPHRQPSLVEFLIDSARGLFHSVSVIRTTFSTVFTMGALAVLMPSAHAKDFEPPTLAVADTSGIRGRINPRSKARWHHSSSTPKVQSKGAPPEKQIELRLWRTSESNTDLNFESAPKANIPESSYQSSLPKVRLALRALFQTPPAQEKDASLAISREAEGTESPLILTNRLRISPQLNKVLPRTQSHLEFPSTPRSQDQIRGKGNWNESSINDARAQMGRGISQRLGQGESPIISIHRSIQRKIVSIDEWVHGKGVEVDSSPLTIRQSVKADSKGFLDSMLSGPKFGTRARIASFDIELIERIGLSLGPLGELGAYGGIGLSGKRVGAYWSCGDISLNWEADDTHGPLDFPKGSGRLAYSTDLRGDCRLMIEVLFDSEGNAGVGFSLSTFVRLFDPPKSRSEKIENRTSMVAIALAIGNTAARRNRQSHRIQSVRVQ